MIFLLMYTFLMLSKFKNTLLVHVGVGRACANMLAANTCVTLEYVSTEPETSWARVCLCTEGCIRTVGVEADVV